VNQLKLFGWGQRHPGWRHYRWHSGEGSTTGIAAEVALGSITTGGQHTSGIIGTFGNTGGGESMKSVMILILPKV